MLGLESPIPLQSGLGVDDIVQYRHEPLFGERPRQETEVTIGQLQLAERLVGGLPIGLNSAGDDHLMEVVSHDMDTTLQRGGQELGDGRLPGSRNAVDEPDFAHARCHISVPMGGHRAIITQSRGICTGSSYR